MSITTTVVIAGREAIGTRPVASRTRHNKVSGREFRDIHAVHSTVEDQDRLATIPRHDTKVTGVANAMALATDILPGTRLTILRVEEELIVRRVADNDCAIGSARRSPNGIRPRTGDALGGLQNAVVDRSEPQGRVSDLVVGGVGCAFVAARDGIGPEADFVRAHPFAVADLCHGDHAGSLGVIGIGDVVNHVAPRHEVITGLMGELLTVRRIALI